MDISDKFAEAIRRFRRDRESEPLDRAAKSYSRLGIGRTSADEVAREALGRAFQEVADPAVPEELAGKKVRRAIEEVRRVVRRTLLREAPIDAAVLRLGREDAGFKQVEQRDYLMTLQRTAHLVFRMALSTTPPAGRRLSERTHDLVVLWLELTRWGYRYHTPGGPALPANPESRRKAFQRAKNDFLALADAIIKEQLDNASSSDRQIWLDVQKAFHGGRLPALLDLTPALEA